MVRAVLHLGAHRCATTTFQSYLDLNEDILSRGGVAVWTPKTTRNGLFDGLFGPTSTYDERIPNACERVQKALSQIPEDTLLVSEENMIGAPFDNLDQRSLYPGFVKRLTRFRRAFAGRIGRIGLAIRSYDALWSSTFSYAVWRGYRMPDPDQLQQLAFQPRSWRHLIAELRQIFPTTPIQVWRFEDFANRPFQQLATLSDWAGDENELRLLLTKKNYSRDTQNLRRLLRNAGREADASSLPQVRRPWVPFTTAQVDRMKACYAEDLDWLRATTDPFITFQQQAAAKALTRPDTGDRHEFKRKMGRTGRERAAW